MAENCHSKSLSLQSIRLSTTIYNWLRQLIARNKAKQPQLKNQLTKSHESSLPTIGHDRTLVFEDHLGVHLVQAEISLVRRYALQTYLGSA
jgi:hypothetical protein